MGLSKKPYKGCRDFFPAQKRIQNFIFQKMKESADIYGYDPYDGPLLEEVELYRAKSGQELINEQIYSFTDRGDRFVAIRPEMTPTLARMVAQIHRETPKPIRLYSIPNLMRYEKPQKGRLREHWQFNCDIFGAPSRNGEFEILQVATYLMNSFGASNNHFEILVNDRSIVETIFKDLMNLNTETSYKLYKIVDRSKKVSKEDLDAMIKELNLSEKNNKILECYLEFTSFQQVISFLETNEKNEIAHGLSEFLDLVINSNLKEYITYDPTIVRGLDYYTGLVFEIFDKHPENKRAICGGGSYQDLLKIFDEPPVPGVGFGLGDVTLTDFLKVHDLLPNHIESPDCQLFLTFQDSLCTSKCLNLANELRAKHIKVVTHLEPLKFNKVFPLAEKRGASIVGLMGSQELNNNTIQLKNMSSKKQITLDISKIDEIIKVIHE